jgi:hypothetical protein
VNRERQVFRNRYYTSKVAKLKNTKPRQWWNDVKRIAGMAPATLTGDIIRSDPLQIDGKSNKVIADLINTALLEPMQEYQALDCLPSIDDNSEIIISSMFLRCIQHY